ncbi:MAG: NAD(P)H-dependent oxidoreductase [Dehalococcoidia bacterium]|nr:NAD(P)H-dependent oxidoreductase [Dehalococcoidia bacterium]
MSPDSSKIRVCLVNGSLRGRHASSLRFVQDIARRLPDVSCRKTAVTVLGNPHRHYDAETLREIAEADALVLVFPLYAYGLPGALMRLLEELQGYIQAGSPHNRSARVYVVVNCAFPRPELTTGEAVRVVRNFCRRLSLNWRFALCIGTGPVVARTRRLPFVDRKLKRAYTAMVADIQDAHADPPADFFIHPIIPEPIIRRIKEHYEKKGEMMLQRDTRTEALTR